MKAKIPRLKPITGIPKDFGAELRAMPTEQLEAMAEGCTPAEVAFIESLTTAQLNAVVDGKPT